MPVPFAHAGHWLWSLVYAAPAFLLGGALLWQHFKERGTRRDRIDRNRNPSDPADD